MMLIMTWKQIYIILHRDQNYTIIMNEQYNSVPVQNLPNNIVTSEHLRFFYKYGFMVIRGLHSKQQTQSAIEGAKTLLQEHKTALDRGKGEIAFVGLPEHKRSTWSRCEEERLLNYFEYEENHKMCQDLIGQFQFKPPRPGPGYYTFAPRFYNWGQDPKIAGSEKEVYLLDRYDVQKLPEEMSDWSREFIKNGNQLQYSFSPSIDNNWHIDGIAHNKVGIFNLLWGSFINTLPKGNMGNLILIPGSHHVVARHLRKGQFFHYDGKTEKPKPLPSLKAPSICDGNFYSLLVESGDIVLAHPWLAHGVGTNLSRQIRLAVYCRLVTEQFFTKHRSEMAGTLLPSTTTDLPDPQKWSGDYWANLPAINEWIKANKIYLGQYDNGQLQKALMEE